MSSLLSRRSTPDDNGHITAFIILTLTASGQFADLDVQIPHGRIGWVRWREKRFVRTYGGYDEGRLILNLDEGFEEEEAQWVADTITALIDVLYAPFGTSVGIIKIAPEMIDGQSVDLEEVAATFEDMDQRWIDLRQSYWPTDEPIRAALIALPAVLASSNDHESGLPAALQY